MYQQQAAKILPNLLHQSIAAGQNPAITLTSGSMAPLLRPGDQIVLRETAVANLQPGDIVTLHDPIGLLTHRFWRADNQHIWTRGDRPLSFDPPADHEQLIGQVIARRRHQRQLDLTTGAGNWLNRHLTKLNDWDYRWNNKTKTPRPAWQRRPVRGIIFIWSTLITILIGELMAKHQPQNPL